MQIQHVAPSRPEANEPLAGSARRAGAAPAKFELAREWPPAAKVRGDLARSVGFSRRQFEGRSGPVGSVALALLMAPERTASTAVEGAARSTPASRASGARASSCHAAASSLVGSVNVGSVNVDRANIDRERGESQFVVPECVGSADAGEQAGQHAATTVSGRLVDEPLDGVRLPRSVSTPESVCAHEQAATPRWTRPLVDRALTSMRGVRQFVGVGGDSILGARWREQGTLTREPVVAANRGSDIGRKARCEGSSAPIAGLGSTLRGEFVNHLRRTPQSALSGTRRALAKCEQLFASAWTNLDRGINVRGAAPRADFFGALGREVGPGGKAPVQKGPGAAIAPTADLATCEWATSEWASAAVFTSLLALLFML